jgi:DNA invertase Pin-like site-specific DNA recombinase
MAKIGYSRISTSEQTMDLQTDALRGAGCTKIFSDVSSGSKDDRPGLAACLEYLRPGDTLVLWKLDRLGRRLPHLLQTVEDLERRGIEFASLTENIDTSSPTGKLIFHVFGAIAEFERANLRERVNAGLAAARDRGRVGGRPNVVGADRQQAFRAMVEQGLSSSEVCAALQISRPTFFRMKSKLLDSHSN